MGITKNKVAIVGAGLSGLACAHELNKNGFDITLFENSSNIGGRVQSDQLDGFILDHGFQVYLPSYEKGQYYFKYDELELRSFAKGAIIKIDNKLVTIADPIQNFSKTISTLRAPIGTLWDKFLILLLKIKASQISESVDLELTTADFLMSFGFSKTIIKRFFKPFFSGVFLEKDLSTPAHFFLYLFDKFSKDGATLPLNGMKELPQQLANEISQKELGRVIADEDKNQLSHRFDFTVDARSQAGAYHQVTTFYYKTQSTNFVSKFLYLNSDDDGPVNHFACLSAVSENYAPKGWHLYSVNTLELDVAEIDIKRHLTKFLGSEEVNQWSFIKSYSIKKALPQNSQYTEQTGKKIISQKYTCADFLESPSIQRALESGFKVAESIIESAQRPTQ